MKFHIACFIKIVFFSFFISVSCAMFVKRTSQQDFLYKLIPIDNLGVIFLENKKTLIKLSSSANINNEYQYNFIVNDGKNLIDNLNFGKSINVYKKAYIKNLATSPVFDMQHIFLLKKDGYIQCYDRYTDQLKWSFKIFKSIKGNFVNISIHDSRLTVVFNNMLFVLDKSTGSEIIYKSLISTIISSVVFNGNILCFQTHFNLHFIDLNTKKEIKKQYGVYGDLMTNQVVSPIFYKNGVLATHLYNQVIYLPMNDNVKEIKFLPNFVSDIESVISQLNINKSNGVSCQPILCEDDLFVSFGYSKLIKYDLKICKKLWSVDIPGITHITKLDNLIFCVGYANQLTIVDASSGKVLFVKNLPVLNTNAFLPPLVINNCVCLTAKSDKTMILISLEQDRSIKTISLSDKLNRCDILSIIPVDKDLILFTSKKAIKLS